MTAPATVTVVIAAWRASGTLRRAIESALAEPQVSRVVVIDDASPDDTLAVARASDDGSGRLTVLEQAVNGGPSAARNRALAGLDTDWWTVLDSDDSMLPGRIGTLLRHAGEADLIADDLYQVMDGDTRPPTRSLLGPSFKAPMAVSLAEFVSSNVSRPGVERKELGFIKPLIRSSLVRDTGLRYDEAMRLGEDYDLYCRMMAGGGRLLVVPAAGYVSVVRADSLSGRHSIEDLRRLRDCDVALAALPGITAADRAAFREHTASVDCRLQWRLLIEAVKDRDPLAALRTFLRPWPVPAYLAARLVEQVKLRTRARIDRPATSGNN